MSNAQTYGIVVNENVEGNALEAVTNLARAHNALAREYDASEFIQGKIGTLKHAIKGAHSWFGVDRAEKEFKHKAGTRLLFVTQMSKRDLGAKFLHAAGVRWIAEEDIGTMDDFFRCVESPLEDVDMDPSKHEIPEETMATCREIFTRVPKVNGFWMDDAAQIDVSPAKDFKNRHVQHKTDREKRRGVRDAATHSQGSR